MQEALAQCDLQKVDRAPQTTNRQQDRYTGFEEAAIDVVLQARLVDIGLSGRVFHLGVDLAQEFIQVGLMDCSKEPQWFAWTMLAATALQSRLQDRRGSL